MQWIQAKIISNIYISEDILCLTVAGNSFTGKAGQFFMLRAWDKDPLLSRPLSIYNLQPGKLQFLYRIAGKGTGILSQMTTGQSIRLLGPLGKHFTIHDGKIALVAGGVGIAPLSFLARTLEGKCDLFAGFKSNVFAAEELESIVNKLYITTENGSKGHHGLVTDIFKPADYNAVYCCGPEPMMKQIVCLCRPYGIPVQVSMERRMACGVGVCMGCTCRTINGLQRVCKDGPVFAGEEVFTGE